MKRVKKYKVKERKEEKNRSMKGRQEMKMKKNVLYRTNR